MEIAVLSQVRQAQLEVNRSPNLLAHLEVYQALSLFETPCDLPKYATSLVPATF